MIFTLPFIKHQHRSAGPTRRYALDRCLDGYRGGIYAMSVCSNGSLLAAGGKYATHFLNIALHLRSSGENGLRIYDLREKKEVKLPSQMNQPLRQITALRWITGPEDPWEVLCLGDVRGNISVWRQNVRLVSALNIFDHYLTFAVSIRGDCLPSSWKWLRNTLHRLG